MTSQRTCFFCCFFLRPTLKCETEQEERLKSKREARDFLKQCSMIKIGAFWMEILLDFSYSICSTGSDETPLFR